MAGKVFISYRRDDAKYQARMIHEAFCKAIPGDHVFMDVDSIPPGANFRKILKDWVNQCDVLLALIGPGWIDASDPKTKRRQLDNPSDFVRIEIGEALARGIPVVPVLLDGTPMPDVDSLPDDLKELVDRQAELVDYRTFEADVERLIRKLRLTSDKGTDKPPMRRPSSPTPQQAPVSASEALVIAAFFAIASLPVMLATGKLFASLQWNWFGPHLGPASSGTLAAGILVVVLALALVLWRGAEIRGEEVAFYWLGLSIVSIVVLFLLFVGLNWNRDAVLACLLAGGMLVVVSALALVRGRGAEIRGAEVAIYWLGLSILVSLAMAVLFGSFRLGGLFVGLFAGMMLAAISGVILLWR